ncbi:alpha/beta fold hydrolase [Sphingomicrobium clamense]|uniref:Alpha/beta hydrolase n=1 Tax=Sphingomicrobium clamense TaxID=2851013 RepID=A0ABS6V7K2_9SPHN|nr:alpha/beta hydrolase [Sphingomicrobium sp. B8]MBW0145558.1 alpha/beta hydrolase [Sphingomicrobium sp. B8]
MARFKDRFFNSTNGLKLHYRDYDGPRDRPPILCLPGLTRNARDFEPVGDRFGGEWRVLAMSFRGRGLSANDPDSANYVPKTYAGDVLKFLDELGIADAVFVGTSLGGIVTMLLADSDDERIAGALINDIGPEIVDEGIARIGQYVGVPVYFDDWAAAAAGFAERMKPIYPAWDLGDWERFARRVMREEADGRIGLAYDMAIRDNFVKAQGEPPVSAWHLLENLKDKPVTILRGGTSDLFDEATAKRMERELANSELVTIPDVGHAPSLDEPESLAALERLLAKIEV